MIPVDRAGIGEPAILTKEYSRGKKKGKTELELVLAALEKHRSDGKSDGEFSFEFNRYKENEVRTTLEQLFHGKCAYCEQRYAGLQPMDVEHWRPKGEIHLGDGRKFKPGYYWLAATWENLLPSCIDCNRSRKQFDSIEQITITLGKANQFPLEPLTDPVRAHDQDVATERPLLVNPCIDTPDTHLKFTDEGLVLGLTPNGVDSIRVYALNRGELVRDRRAVMRLLEYRLIVLEMLAPMIELRRDETNDPADVLLTLLEDLVNFEITETVAMAASDRPFAGMVRQRLRRDAPQLF